MPILIVDDSDHDREMIHRFLKRFQEEHPVFTVKDGEEALDFVFCKGQYAERRNIVPYFIILDIKMPKVSGLEVLRHLRQNPRTRLVPVLIFTSSSMESDVQSAYEHQANAYVVKPVNYEDFVEAIAKITNVWIKLNVQPST